MKYTKKQRHQIYKKAYKWLVAQNTIGGSYGICVSIAKIVFKSTESDYLVNIKHFPELFLFKTNDNRNWAIYDLIDQYHNGVLSLDDIQERRQTILELCIEMTKP